MNVQATIIAPSPAWDECHKAELGSLGECDCLFVTSYDTGYDFDSGWYCDGATATLVDAHTDGGHMSRETVAAIIGETELAAAEARVAAVLAEAWTMEQEDRT